MTRRLPLRREETLQRAKQLRVTQVPAEQLVWGILRNRRLGGLKFRRQFPLGPFIADFYCHEVRLVIELDGDSHDYRQQEDAERTRYLETHQLQVFRVVNADVHADLEAVAIGILKVARIDGSGWLSQRTQCVTDGKTPSP